MHTKFNMSMYGLLVTMLQDRSLSLTTESCALSQSATQPLPL